MAASSIDTSRKQPLPVLARPATAAAMDMAAIRPPMVSQMGKPTRSGAVSGVPVIDMMPDSPWMTWS
jgi:DNA-binding transcriptional regulator YdaS (Cro superfamily)